MKISGFSNFTLILLYFYLIFIFIFMFILFFYFLFLLYFYFNLPKLNFVVILQMEVGTGKNFAIIAKLDNQRPLGFWRPFSCQRFYKKGGPHFHSTPPPKPSLCSLQRAPSAPSIPALYSSRTPEHPSTRVVLLHSRAPRPAFP